MIDVAARLPREKVPLQHVSMNIGHACVGVFNQGHHNMTHIHTVRYVPSPFSHTCLCFGPNSEDWASHAQSTDPLLSQP